VKEDFLHDVAIQRHVLESSGLTLSGADVMVVNTNCEFPELDNFLRVQDVTEQTDEILATLPAQLGAFKRVIQQPAPPDVTIGDHCKNPNDCPFKQHCWAKVDGRPLVFDIPRLSADKKAELREQDILFVDDLPEDYPLTLAQEEFVHRLSNGHREVNAEEISQALGELEYPLYFFDFETYGSAIPRFDGMRPYEQLPFQFSCHRLDKDGELTHDDYLHLDQRTGHHCGLWRGV
jgi:hypothetical protein